MFDVSPSTPNVRPTDPTKAIFRRLPSQPIHIPIPPSLVESPHLYSPQSIFRRASSTPALPSQEDEEWLRDTIPLGTEEGQKEPTPSSSRSPLVSSVTEGEKVTQSRGRSSDPRIRSNVPPSPPLVRWRQSTSPARALIR